MPIFATLFSGLFSSIAGFFAAGVAKKTAYALAAIAVFAVLTIAFIAFISSAVNAAIYAITLSYGIQLGFAVFMPYNIESCAAAVIAAHVARALYDWNVSNLRLAAYTG